MSLFCGKYIFFQGGGDAVTLGLLRSGENGGVVNSIGIVMDEVLASIAEQERVRTLQRQAQGIAAAKEKGKHLGRPRAQFPDGWDEIHGKWKRGEVTAKEAMTSLGLKRSTFYKLVNLYNESPL